MSRNETQHINSDCWVLLPLPNLRVEPSRKFSHDVPDIKMVRAKTGLSQQQFSEKLNISPRTLQNWEQGTRNPTGAAVTLMRLLEKKPELIMDA